MTANPSNLTATEVGTVLGMGLIEGRDHDALHETEASLVAGARIPQPEYVLERFVLSACAAAHAAGAYLPPQVRKDAAAGFMEWFHRAANQSATLRAALQVFPVRLPIYSAAANEDQRNGPKQPNELVLSKLSFAFGDTLVARARSGADAEGLCRALVMAVAD